MSDKKLVTPVGRVSYPHLFEPKMNTMSEKKEWSVDLLFDKKTDLKALKKIAEQAAKEKWGGEVPEKLRLPFKNGDDKKNPEYQDKIYITFKTSYQKPGVVDENVQDIISKADVYGGCFGRVSFNAFAYAIKGNKGVSFGLSHFQKTAEGESFTTKTQVEDAFDAVESDDPASYEDNSELLDK